MRFYDWANEKLYPLLGPADLAPYQPAPEQKLTAVCPLCREPMTDHYFDRTEHDAVLFCPAPEIPNNRDQLPLNEFGHVRT